MIVFIIISLPINNILLAKLIFTAISDYFDIFIILVTYLIIIFLFINIIKQY